MKPGDLVIINTIGLQRHNGYDGTLAIVRKRIDDIILVNDEVPDMWEVYCFRLSRKMIFFEDELKIISSGKE